MTISKRQFTQLSAMGIPLWTSCQSNESSVTENQEGGIKPPIDWNTIKDTRLFLDILNSVGLSIGEISLTDHQLNIGLLTWHFSTQTTISLDQNVLTTPSLDKIADSVQLKRELWQILSKQGHV